MTTDIIAIDGPAGSGKSTVAKAVASRLHWTYLDTGAMYRAVTVVALARDIDVNDEPAVCAVAEQLQLQFSPVLLANGVDITVAARSEETNRNVSVVASLPSVRAVMVERQRAFANLSKVGVVVEGRDITTVVFPDAATKIFLTASLEERVRRRGDEDGASISRRDEVDASRSASPLRQSDDATLIDTTGKSVEQVVEEIIECHVISTSS